jgi:integrase
LRPGIYELERGLYELVVSRGRGADGRYRQRTQRLRGTLTEAKRARARLMTTGKADDPPAEPDASMRFRDLLDLHLERMAASGHSPRPIEDYGVHIRVHLGPALGDIPIDRLRALDLDRLYDRLSTERGLRPATVQKIHSTARGALRQAVRWGLVSKNVAVDASPPSVRRTEIRVPSPDEVNKLLVEATEPFATLLRLAVATGMRRGELCALRWSDVDLHSATIRVRAGLVMAHGRVFARKNKPLSGAAPVLPALVAVTRAGHILLWRQVIQETTHTRRNQSCGSSSPGRAVRSAAGSSPSSSTRDMR